LVVVKTVADLVREDPAARQVAIDVSGGSPPVTADAELLKLVIQNVMLNAVQAMLGRGRIHVAVTPANGRCRIEISDSGPGISPTIREKLFTPFFTTKARGTGLGLSTAKQFMESHGGRINIDCPPGGGTTVTLELPCSEC
jgi:signal transduction histidine kinase